MLRICFLHPIFFICLFIFAITSDSMSLQPIFDPRMSLISGPAASRTSSLASSVIVPESVASPILDAPPLVLLPVVSRREPHITGKGRDVDDDQLSQEPEPTCAELKSMWHKMRRLSRQMEITNEIPKVRDPFVGGAYDFRPSKYPSSNPYSKAPKSSRISNVFQSTGYQSNNNNRNKLEILLAPKPVSKNFGEIIRDPEEHHRYKNQISSGLPSDDSTITKTYRRPSFRLGFEDFDSNPYPRSAGFKSNGRVPGRFSNYPLPEEALGVYGTVVNTPEEKAKFRSRTRRPPESSFRSRLVGLDHGPSSRGRVPFRAAKPHEEYHYGSLVTHFPSDRSGSASSAGGGSVIGNGMYSNHPMGGYAEFPTEVNQRSSNAGARVERIDKVSTSKQRNSCLRIRGKLCKTDVDCYCIGTSKFFCGGDRCIPQFKSSKYEKTPNWAKNLYFFDNPYESEMLGLYDPIWPIPF